MADSQQDIDWAAVRRAALDCLDATWNMVCFAEWSQGSDYDVKRAALHLAAIDRARDTFRPAMEVLQPGLECATDDSYRHSPVFDSLALAAVGEGPRPDFRFGATAHETAFELLRRAILWVENGLNDELEEMGAPDNYLEGIDDLHKRAPEALRDTLCRLEKRKSLQSLLSGRQLHVLRVWIDREWAAVSRVPANGGQQPAASPSLTPDDEMILAQLAAKRPVTVSMYDLSTAVDISRAKVGQRLAYLRTHKLAARPQGERKGHTITDAGLLAIGQRAQT